MKASDKVCGECGTKLRREGLHRLFDDVTGHIVWCPTCGSYVRSEEGVFEEELLKDMNERDEDEIAQD